MNEFAFQRNKNLDQLCFEIPGNPVTKQSVSVGVATDKSGAPVFETSKNGKRRVKTIKFTANKKRNDMAFLKWGFTLQRPAAPFELWDCAIEVVKLHYIFPWTKEAQKQKFIDGYVYKTSRPDLIDNLNKALFDAMSGIIYKDDSQVVKLNDVLKYYGDPPGTILIIRKLK